MWQTKIKQNFFEICQKQRNPNIIVLNRLIQLFQMSHCTLNNQNGKILG